MIDQTTHEGQVPESVSTLAVASVAHRQEISLSSPNTVAQVEARRSEQNSSVSYRYKYVLAITDDQQVQQSMSGIFANAQNVLITGGTFVSLCCGCVRDFVTYSMNRTFSPPILVESL